MDNIQEGVSAVFVTNISPAAQPKTVGDFFAYCGAIKQLVVRKNAQAADSAQEAIVFFETSAAARTALLLTNALIVDRAITVVPYTASAEAPKGGPEQVTVQAADIEQKNYPVPDSERTKSSVVASLIVAGYSLGADILAAARDYDDKHKVTSQLYAMGEAAVAKATELDAQYLHLGDKMKQLNTAMQNVDSQYKIKEKVNSSMQSVGEVIVLTAETAKVLAQQAAEQPYIAQGVNAVVNVGHSIAKVVEDEAAAVSAGIEAKRRATHLAAPAPSPAEPASPSPSQPTSAPVPAPPAVPVTEVPK